MADHFNKLSRGKIAAGDMEIGGAPVARVSVFTFDNTTGGGGSGVWTNPTSGSILVMGVDINVTTTSGASGTLDIGTAAGATTTSDNLLDGVNVAAATGWKSSAVAGGTNGLGVGSLASGQFITCTISAGTAGSLAGSGYVTWAPLPS